MYKPYIHTIRDMTPLSALGFVMITAILCRGSIGESETRATDSWGTYKPCEKIYGGCMKRFVDEAYVKPSITADGSLHFPNDFFNRVCGYFINGSVCYELATSDECEPSFRPNNIIKNFNNLSIKFCRNTDALNTLVPCLNDKESFEAYMRAIQYEGSEQESSCNVAKEQIRRILRLVKDRCGDAEYISLKTVLADIGEDLSTLFIENEDPSCSIDVSTLTPDRRRRDVASSTIKKMIDLWMS